MTLLCIKTLFYNFKSSNKSSNDEYNIILSQMGASGYGGGYQQGYGNPGYGNYNNPGFNQGFNQGFQPGYNQGFNPDFNNGGGGLVRQ